MKILKGFLIKIFGDRVLEGHFKMMLFQGLAQFLESKISFWQDALGDHF